MGRKTHAAEGADRLSLAVAEAARILCGDLAACSKMMRLYLDVATATEDYDERSAHVQDAVALVGAEAKLGEAIAQVRSEKRQHIQVERNAQSTANAPQKAPNSAPPGTKKPSKSAEKPDKSPAQERGGG